MDREERRRETVAYIREMAKTPVGLPKGAVGTPMVVRAVVRVPVP
jgi:hypothetical protein